MLQQHRPLCLFHFHLRAFAFAVPSQNTRPQIFKQLASAIIHISVKCDYLTETFLAMLYAPDPPVNHCLTLLILSFIYSLLIDLFLLPTPAYEYKCHKRMGQGARSTEQCLYGTKGCSVDTSVGKYT